MCYSAQIRADYARFAREYGAVLSLKDFYDLFWRRLHDPQIQVPRGVEAAFATPQSDAERNIKTLIADYATQRASALGADLEKQQRRLAAAQQKLAVKPTKTAANEERIATKKIAWLQGLIADLQRTHQVAADARIYPGTFVPVMVLEGGRKIFKPMRYHCRPAHVSASFDAEYPGCYNARRNSLKGFWRNQYGHTHGVVILSAFYEHVPLALVEGNRNATPSELQKTTVVEFKPDTDQDLLAACIWSRWSAPGEPDLLSFALITEDPPPEILAVGHDRCIVPIRPEDLDAWLRPNASRLGDQDEILDRRLRPYFQHQRVGGSEEDSPRSGAPE